MSFALKIAAFFLIFCFISLLVYFLVVRAYYWGSRNDPPGKD